MNKKSLREELRLLKQYSERKFKELNETLRMRLSTYQRIRKYFPAQRGENLVEYFCRLSKHLGDTDYDRT